MNIYNKYSQLKTTRLMMAGLKAAALMTARLKAAMLMTARLKAATLMAVVFLVATFITACSSDEHLDVNDKEGMAISFDCKAQQATRSASLVSITDNFLVYGVKKRAENGYESVFANYKVEYAENTAGTTGSNTNDWEYVGKGTNQSIKYWDYGCSPYIFWGLAPAPATPFATGADGTPKEYTLHLDAEQTDYDVVANRTYYTQPVVVTSGAYKQTVVMPFHCMLSRIRFAFYETIPGYAVKNVEFMVAAQPAVSECTLGGDFVMKGDLKLTYDIDAEGAHQHPTTVVDWSNAPAESDRVTHRSFGQLSYTFADENKLTGTAETDKIYLGKISSSPTYSKGNDNDGYYTYILPNPNNTAQLTLRCNYTLVSTDGSGQEIVVKDATAAVPAEYCRWHANTSYTYLFKFTDSKLKPVTFVAYGEISNTTDNQQGTITTVGEYSITTYQEGSTDANGVEYETMKDVEVTVVQHTENTDTPNYIALNSKDEKTTGSPLDYVIIYHQNTLKEWVVETEVSSVTEPSMGVYRETIESIDSEGKAHFTPDMPGTYRIEYWHRGQGETEDVKWAVKILKIKGDELKLEEYDKWQSGSSTTTEW